MAVTDTSRFYKGVKIEFEGGIWEVLEYHHSKMAQRSPVVKTKLRNIVTGSVQERNFRSGETFNLPDVERKKMQFLYKEEINILFYKGKTMGVELPITVDLQVIHTEPGFRGDTATGGSKPAKLETGVIIPVPLFIDVGDLIKVDTRSGTYIERMKKK